MAEQALLQEKVTTGAKVVFILLIGALSMFFAEVCSGSSVLWFITSWAWMVTFWLYLAHTVFFLNLALYFRRTSLTSLYLWGILFALYESWITKVDWYGYPGATTPSPTFLGFAYSEFSMITFFWHPVMSFILPVLAFEILSGRALPGHLSVLTKGRRNWLLAGAILVIGALFLAANSQQNLVASAVTALGSFAIIGVLYAIASRKYGKQFSIESLRLGKAGMAIVTLYLAALYVASFFLIFPERIAPPLTLLLTLAIYAAIILLIYLRRPDEARPAAVPEDGRMFGLKEAAIWAAAFTVLAAAFCLIGPVSSYIMLGIYLALLAVALGLFALTVINTARYWKRAGA